MQTATILCDAQHNTLKLVHIAPFVKSLAGCVAECPVSVLSSRLTPGIAYQQHVKSVGVIG